MLTNSAAARDVRHLLHGYVELKTYRESGPTVITGGKGIYVMDENGTPYIEGAAGMWCTAFGFGEQALIDAATEQLHKLPYYHTLASKSVNPAIDLAERLAALVPIDDAKIYFAVSGSEANDFLIKFIRYYNNAVGRPAKKKIIARSNGYHGATAMAASLTGIPANHLNFDLPLPGILHVSDPNYFRYSLPGETEADFADRLARELEETILREGPETIAAFIAEPVTGGGGVTIPPAPYYQKVQEILARYEVFFLDDEVITGFHRTGEFWGCQTLQFRPDAMTLAKGLTSAYQPLSAVVLSDEIYRGLELGSSTFGFFGHGTTYSGHPVGCAVALKVLDLITERDIAGHVRRVSRQFQKRLDVFRDHPFVGDVRSVGLMGAVEFVADKNSKTPFQPVGSFASRLKSRAEEHYKLICRALPGCDGCAFSPPLIITEDEVDEMFSRFEKALDDVTAQFAKETGKPMP
jgi:4-aminobutyrate---pyruvate transaminase